VSYPVLAAVALMVAVVVALPLRRLALRFGILDHPGSHKIHGQPVPYLGGVSVLAGAAAGMPLGGGPGIALVLIGLVCVLGVFDDVRFASVRAKLLIQSAVAVAAVAFGYSWQITDSPLLNGGISVLWMVGLSNAFNLLDNMDGLCAGVAATALLGMAIIDPDVAPLAVPVGAAAAGFFLVNISPRRMFLGDGGSLPLGFAVALTSITLANGARGLHSVVLLGFPVALAAFDTSLVIVARLRTGRPVQLGGQDHFSHRLKLLGWTRWHILAAALVAQAAGVLIAGLAGRYPLNEAWLAVPIAVAYLGAWLRLLSIDPYSAGVDSRPEVVSA